MPIVVSEHFTSRSLGNDTAQMVFKLVGSEDEGAIFDAAVMAAPGSFRSMDISGLSVKPEGGGVWEATADYSSGAEKKKLTGDSTYTFDTTGGTQHITQSRETVGYGGPPGLTFKNAIGVTKDSVEGVDITVPVYAWTETHYLPITLIDPGYKRSLFFLTGCMNDAAFRGYERGEVLFKGASGSQRKISDVEITYHFAASPNVEVATGTLSGLSTTDIKLGWDYIWFSYVDDISGNFMIKKPLAVLIERVYRFGDFSLMGIGVAQ